MPTQGNPTDPLYSELMDDDLLDLVEMFVAELPERIAAIKTAINEEDIAALGSLAHQLKGSAGGYGFPSISDAARAVESSAKAGEDAQTLLEQVRALADLCDRARAPATST